MGTEALSRISPAALPYLQPLSPTAKFRKHRVLYSLRIALERVRQHHGLCVYAYVVMPEHVHLLVNEPEPGTLAQAMQSLKQRGEAGLTRGRPVLAGSLLRFKRLERAQVRGETSFHPPQSREAWVGRAARGLDLEQLPPLPERSSRSGGDRVAVDGAEERTRRDISYSSGASPAEKPPPKRRLDGAPSRVGTRDRPGHPATKSGESSPHCGALSTSFLRAVSLIGT